MRYIKLNEHPKNFYTTWQAGSGGDILLRVWYDDPRCTKQVLHDFTYSDAKSLKIETFVQNNTDYITTPGVFTVNVQNNGTIQYQILSR